MRMTIATVLLLLASPGFAQDTETRINLVCLGAGSANRASVATANVWNNSGDTATANIVGNRSVPFDDQVNLWVEGAEGRVRMPRAMLPAIRGGDGGWFKIKNVQFTEGEITGSVSVNPINNPKLRIDRMTGAISISGKAGDYAGRCTRYDPATAQRQF